jgi:predicted RNA-binding protein Jag
MCKSKGILLPVMCNQKMNSYLKEITDFCGIDKDVTTHTARHTFATTVTLANGVALTNVAKMLGHTSTRMTEHYAKVLNHNIYSDMKKVKSNTDGREIARYFFMNFIVVREKAKSHLNLFVFNPFKQIRIFALKYQ